MTWTQNFSIVSFHKVSPEKTVLTVARIKTNQLQILFPFNITQRQERRMRNPPNHSVKKLIQRGTKKWTRHDNFRILLRSISILHINMYSQYHSKITHLFILHRPYYLVTIRYQETSNMQLLIQSFQVLMESQQHPSITTTANKTQIKGTGSNHFNVSELYPKS